MAQNGSIDTTTRRFNSLHGGQARSEPDLGEANVRTASWTSENGKQLAVSATSFTKQAATAAMSDLIGSYTSIGLDPEQDNFDALDLMAQRIIDLLTSNVYTFANLTRFERNLLFRYFYKTNPVIGRLIDLHTDLPLSKTRLQAPSDLPDIAKDYIMQFYERLLDRLNFASFLRDLVLTHCIYGESVALVDDYYKDFDRVLQDIHVLEEHVFNYSDEDAKFMETVESVYEKNPKDVKVQDRIKYIKLKFSNFFEPDYTGPDRLSVLPFYKIQEYLENDDVDYLAVKYQLSESLNQLLAAKVDDSFLHEVGYSEGMTAMLADPELHQDKTVVIDSDSYDGYPFVFQLKRPEGSSIILRTINEALEWEAAKRAMRAKIESIGKVGRVITAPGLSEGQINMLRAEVQLMLDDPGYAIVSNFDINWQEVNAELRQQLDDLTGAAERITETLALGGGMPLTLISGDSQYSGGSIKLEILNVEYHSFKQRLQSLIEERLFKPIALRKGFVSVDDWGNPVVCYPRLTFSRVSLRDESVFDILFSLYQKGSMPVSIIYDILNLDPDDVKRGIETDLWTVNDPNFNELTRGMLSTAIDDVYQNTDLTQRLIDELGLNPIQQDAQEVMEDGVYDPDIDDFQHPGLPSSDDAPAEDEGDPDKNNDDEVDDSQPIPPEQLQPKDAPTFNNVEDQERWQAPDVPDPSKPADFDWGDK